MIRRVFVAAVLTAVVATLGYAQRGGGGGMGGGGQMGGGQMGGGGGRGPQVDKLELLANEFKFTPDQKTAIGGILDAAQAQANPILPQIVDQKKAMLELAAEGKDPGEVTKQLAALDAQMLSIEASAFTQTLAKLDDKQKSKAPKLFDVMAGMFTAQGGWHKSN